MARLEDNGLGVEMHIDGEYVASWTAIGLNDNQKRIVESMLEAAAKYGENKKTEEIKKVLNI